MEDGAATVDISATPYDPLRQTLYTPTELMSGFDGSDVSKTLDARIGAHFRTSGGRSPVSIVEALGQRLHDFGLDRALEPLIAQQPKPLIVGIMGGHSVGRDQEPYTKVVELAWRLTREGYLVATGGGLGIMEAANLGAYLASYAEDVLRNAVDSLKTVPDYTHDAAKYYQVAQQIVREYPSASRSLALATWIYEEEPINQFATHIAKYFSNSIREDGLLAMARGGVVFARGGAGTRQEIFQDAAQNSYFVGGWRSPMAFLGRSDFGGPLSISELVELTAQLDADPWGNMVGSFDTPAEVVTFIKTTSPKRDPHAPQDARRSRSRMRGHAIPAN
jgi:predicted Rossmann-fold nucleotide-binding protein